MNFRQGTDLQSIHVCDVDPTLGIGIPGGTPNMLLLRTDNNSIYYFKGPLDTDWELCGMGTVVPPVPGGSANHFDDFISTANVGYSLVNNSGNSVVDFNSGPSPAPMCGIIRLGVFPPTDEAQIFINFNRIFASTYPGPFFRFISPTTYEVEWRAQVTIAEPTFAENYLCAIGINDGSVGNYANFLKGTWFEADFDNGNSNWFAITSNAGPKTKVDTGILVDTNVHRFKVVCEYGVVARFYIDSILVATIVTDLPVGIFPQSVNIYPNIYMARKVGANACEIFVDYQNFNWDIVR